jgi:hypothetical protein
MSDSSGSPEAKATRLPDVGRHAACRQGVPGRGGPWAAARQKRKDPNRCHPKPPPPCIFPFRSIHRGAAAHAGAERGLWLIAGPETNATLQRHAFCSSSSSSSPALLLRNDSMPEKRYRLPLCLFIMFRETICGNVDYLT